MKMLPLQKGREIEAAVTAGQLTQLLKKSFSQVGLDSQDFQDLLLGSVDEVVVAYEDSSRLWPDRTANSTKQRFSNV